MLSRIKDDAGKVVVSTYPSRVHRQFTKAEHEEMYQYIMEQGKTQDTYVSWNPRKADLPAYARGGDEDVSEVIAFTLDADVFGAAHKEKNLPLTKQEVMELLKAAGLEPTYWVDSGYGLYAIYVFEESVVLDSDSIRKKIEGVLKGFGKYVSNLFSEKGWKLDEVFCISHMFRGPGSINHKIDGQTPECKVIADNGLFFGLDDFESYYEEPTPKSIPYEVDERIVGSADRIMENCQFMQMLVKDPDAIPEPWWKAMLSNAALANDGREKSHEWSSHYSGYSYEETDRKVDYCIQAKKPCTCEYIRENLGYECPAGGCGVKAPVVHSLLSKQEQIQNWLAKENITLEDILEPYAIGLFALMITENHW